MLKSVSLMAPLALSVSLSWSLLAPTAQAQTAPAPAPAADAVAAPKAEATPAALVDVPSGAEVNRVIGYFLRGQAQGPVLMEAVLCKKTDKVDGKLACVERLGPTVKKGEPIIMLARFFVPKGATYDDVKVKFLLNGEVRSTSDFTLQESWTGYTNTKQITASKPGAWEAQVWRGDVMLATHKVTAQ